MADVTCFLVAAQIESWGYDAIAVSAATGRGLDRLSEVLAGRVSVVAGPSGVGKSSLINAIKLQADAASSGRPGASGGPGANSGSVPESGTAARSGNGSSAEAASSAAPAGHGADVSDERSAGQATEQPISSSSSDINGWLNFCPFSVFQNFKY